MIGSRSIPPKIRIVSLHATIIIRFTVDSIDLGFECWGVGEGTRWGRKIFTARYPPPMMSFRLGAQGSGFQVWVWGHMSQNEPAQNMRRHAFTLCRRPSPASCFYGTNVQIHACRFHVS